MTLKPKIRIAEIIDLPQIVDIYNQAIRLGTATGDMEEFRTEERVTWFHKFTNNEYPIYTALLNDKVVGYATISAYRPGRQAMKRTAEISFFADEHFQSLGIGSALLSYAIEDCARINKDSLLAILLDVNTPSIGLLEKFGFMQWGHMPNIINFNGRVCGHYIYGRNLL